MIGEKAKKALSSNAFLSMLSEKEFEDLWDICRPCEAKAGHVIMKEGDVGDSMYFFVEGLVDVTKSLTLKTGRRDFSSVEKSMVKLDARNVFFFGDMALFENETRSATITAATDCLLFEIKRDDFERLCERSPVLGYKLIKKMAGILCERVRKGNQDILKLTTALSVALSRA